MADLTIEEAPPDALRLDRFMAITHLDGGERGRLNLHNVIFANAGSLVWFEEPDVLCVFHVPARVEHDGPYGVGRYQGTWEDR